MHSLAKSQFSVGILNTIEEVAPEMSNLSRFTVEIGAPAGPPPQTATLSRIPTPTPPDPRRQGHLYFGAAPFACGSAMIFFKSRYLRHFCGATFEFSQHCRESDVSLRKSDVFYRSAGDPGSPTSQPYRGSRHLPRQIPRGRAIFISKRPRLRAVAL